ncbi:MAG: hypothetical protein OEX81_05515 [Candidatus Pacebacteria bacterium]|nr:hypothetical protein [Candidatus Paceibacterota bacterium]
MNHRIITILTVISVLVIGVVLVYSELQPDGIEIDEFVRQDGSIQYTVVNHTDNWVDVHSGQNHYSVAPGDSLTPQGTNFTATEIVSPTVIIGEVEKIEGEYYVCLAQSYCPNLPSWIIGEPFFYDLTIVNLR